MAEGVARASKQIGKGAEQFALCIKGQELPMHEPRGKKGVALTISSHLTTILSNQLQIWTRP